MHQQNQLLRGDFKYTNFIKFKSRTSYEHELLHLILYKEVIPRKGNDPNENTIKFSISRILLQRFVSLKIHNFMRVSFYQGWLYQTIVLEYRKRAYSNVIWKLWCSFREAKEMIPQQRCVSTILWHKTEIVPRRGPIYYRVKIPK